MTHPSSSTSVVLDDVLQADSSDESICVDIRNTAREAYSVRSMSTHNVAVVLNVAGSRIRAFLTLFQFEHKNQHLFADRIAFYKADLRWEIATFVTPVLKYAASQGIMAVVPKPVVHVLELMVQDRWQLVPNNIFTAHLGKFEIVAEPSDLS
ncbi:uncharacterized protein EDB91DRAFT_1255996 [Suillus paluster]|uniref:uncharacterized protein n=1 Tax=Suillus paluster TaxID=48578 RepID=UPI001B86FE06|nr:uncharacterized protein EDB91DRAFT_1255996 [Suillus paluster]KAG1722600.1 hypothetical protein EDB91DRAFT_1255996 [Suillus paluster]